MYTHTRTTFARYPYIPVQTSADAFRALYLAHAAEPPRFRVHDLDRHVLAIDLRRFHPDDLEAAFADLNLSFSFAVLEEQLADLLAELRATVDDDPSQRPLADHELPPLSPYHEASRERGPRCLQRQQRCPGWGGRGEHGCRPGCPRPTFE